MSRDERLSAEAAGLGFDLSAEIRSGGRYAPVVREGTRLHVSGQVPRVGTEVVCIGAAGAEINLARAQHAASICALRALALLQRELGSLERLATVPRVVVYVRSAPDFTQLSEVADGASDLIVRVLGEAGAHARTTVGVLQLPKGATVELELMATAREDV